MELNGVMLVTNCIVMQRAVHHVSALRYDVSASNKRQTLVILEGSPSYIYNFNQRPCLRVELTFTLLVLSSSSTNTASNFVQCSVGRPPLRETLHCTDTVSYKDSDSEPERCPVKSMPPVNQDCEMLQQR